MSQPPRKAPDDSLLLKERYIYAEDLVTGAGQHCKVTLTIKEVKAALIGPPPRAKEGWEVHFEGTPKVFGAAGVTVKRQLIWSTGEKDPAKMAGKRITLYAVKSSSPLAATGYALRIAPPEGGQQP